ncbi:MAG: nucleoside hydrolase [Clostridia bacterium]|nr:nucleoside hydrolase [Clostridia bacterium]
MRTFILGTDWGEDSDDCVAVRILARAHKKGEIKVLGMGINTLIEYSAPSLYRFLEKEGVLDIPVGVDKNCPHQIQRVTYQKRLSAETDKTNDDFEDAVRLYRRAIAKSDGDVEILEVGFLQVIAGALLSQPDDISPKSGMELFCEKVKKIWIMGGKWDQQAGREYNLCNYPFAQRGAHTFITNCPCPITFLGWEIGNQLITGDKLSKDDFLHLALADHGSGSGRESWDPMLVTLALIGDNEKAGYNTVKGFATVNEQGVNFFTEDGNGPHEYVVKARPDSFYSDMINNLIV